MVDSEYSTDNFNSSKICIGAIIENLKILQIVPDHVKTRKICKHAIKKLPLLIKYGPNWYKH